MVWLGYFGVLVLVSNWFSLVHDSQEDDVGYDLQCARKKFFMNGMSLGLKEYSVLFKNTDWIVL